MTNPHRLLVCLAVLCAGCGTQSANQPTNQANSGAAVQEITAANFQTVVTGSSETVLVDFWAPWCGPCVQIKPIVESLAEEYRGDLVVGSINVDDQPSLAQEFGISSIPALLFFREGKLVGTSTGSLSREALKNKIDSVLR